MFSDQRSKRVVLVAHCILNQNVKIDRCAHYPGAMWELVRFLADSGVGILQMPCPELLYLGLDRGADREVPSTVASEDTRVARRMADPEAHALCAELVHGLVRQVVEYTKNGFDVLGIMGINGSPTCGVETGWSEGCETPGPGVFIRILHEELGLSMCGVKALEPEQAVAAARTLLT